VGISQIFWAFSSWSQDGCHNSTYFIHRQPTSRQEEILANSLFLFIKKQILFVNAAMYSHSAQQLKKKEANSVPQKPNKRLSLIFYWSYLSHESIPWLTIGNGKGFEGLILWTKACCQ
jgi:hypothetical protein